MVAGIEVEATREAVWLTSQAPLSVLSSAVAGGGLVAARHILNWHVPEGYDRPDPAADLLDFARRAGVAAPFVGLMTAAWTHEAVSVTEAGDGTTVTVVATVGLGGAIAAGLSGVARRRPSTINLIAVLDARLDVAAAVNGILTMTEAKVGALTAAGIRTADGLPATGTLTDAIAIAWTDRGVTLPYLGPAAPGGWLLARAVRRAMTVALARKTPGQGDGAGDPPEAATSGPRPDSGHRPA